MGIHRARRTCHNDPPSETDVIEKSFLDLRDFPIRTVGEEYGKGFLLGYISGHYEEDSLKGGLLNHCLR